MKFRHSLYETPPIITAKYWDGFTDDLLRWHAVFAPGKGQIEAEWFAPAAKNRSSRKEAYATFDVSWIPEYFQEFKGLKPIPEWPMDDTETCTLEIDMGSQKHAITAAGLFYWMREQPSNQELQVFNRLWVPLQKTVLTALALPFRMPDA